MKKLLYVMLMFVASVSVSAQPMAQNVETNENQVVTEDSNETNPVSTPKQKLDPNDYSFFGVNYATPFDVPDGGIAGLSWSVFGSGWAGFGVSMSCGWQFKGMSDGGGAARVGLGPSYCYPISEHAFVYAPLCADLFFSNDENNKVRTSFGLELLPSIGLKYKRLVIAGGLFLVWVNGADKVSTGFNVSLGFTY